ncbi:MAG: hypothetical protein K2W96_01760 [Gemmataceae bacterium]|nr:hypothetical protein [Gemmataceae bacterium]
MSAILLDNLPAALYEEIQRRAERGKRSVSDEATDLLKAGLEKKQETPKREIELFPSEESPAFDLPRPPSLGQVPYRIGGKREVDPLPE